VHDATEGMVLVDEAYAEFAATRAPSRCSTAVRG
jgi:histidinol-phosphate/aromatic aminotransferase/cobyric acid decarboxylase-like protein